MTPRITTRQVKQRTVWAACELMKRAGCDVVQHETDRGYTLSVIVPDDSPDPHGARLQLALEAGN